MANFHIQMSIKNNMNFKTFYLTENLTATWLGSCINFRKKSDENEQIWQNIMATKKKISEKEFLKNVNIKDLLDDGETWEQWKKNNSDDKINLYKSGDYYFIQTKGFEYLWKKELVTESHEKEIRKYGKLLSDINHEKFVFIFRARDIKSNKFVTNDYVTLSSKFAIEHAESNHVYKDEQQMVIRAKVSTKLVAEASNPGEWFYIGPDIVGDVVYKSLGPDEYDGKIFDLKYSRTIKFT